MPNKSKLLEMGRHAVEAAWLSVLELDRGLPFPAQRLYILHGHESACRRGFHAHKTLRQVMVVMAGEATISIDDGLTVEKFKLSSPSTALVVEPVVWREIDLSVGAVVAVLASETYDANDYIHDYDAFKAYIGKSKQ